ncbi:hypothetical protein HMPREF1982_02911 [Clostridiales bacterium oral taxon 876 str. F0540]|nr:hypothetical protein HMPREF1982_02911 [Clostridiales bacterium oral taxon 876 str. F0540]
MYIPYWSAEDWKRMYRTQLGLVKSEAVNLITKNYSAEPLLMMNLKANP